MLALVGIVTLLGGCTEPSARRDMSPASSSSGSGSAKADDRPAPHVVISPADGATGVALDAALDVAVSDGKLDSVVLTSKGPTGASSTESGGDLQSTAWHREIALGQSTTYTITAKATGESGRSIEQSSTFTTVTPIAPLSVNVVPVEGETVGVGMPIALYLTQPVQDRAAFEQHVHVVTDKPVEGAWHWFSDKELHFRPKEFWPANTNVTVSVGISGLNVGNGIWGVTNTDVHFKVGSAQVSTVDTKTHQMTVTVDGQVVRTVPVSTGRDKYPTKGGIHVVNEKAPMVIMDSATVGIPRNSPDGYYEKVYWNVRISNSGEFVHAAPWSVRSQGRSNVSHGCVNVSTANAQWFYGFSRRGDVVNVVNSPAHLEPTNGFGDWNIPWEQWANGTQKIAAAPVIPETGPLK